MGGTLLVELSLIFFTQPASRCIRSASSLTRPPRGPDHLAVQPTSLQPCAPHQQQDREGPGGRLQELDPDLQGLGGHPGGPLEAMDVHSVPKQHERRFISAVALRAHGKGAGWRTAGRLCPWKTSCRRSCSAAEGTQQGCPHRAVFLPKLHGHGRPQPLGVEGPPARAGVQRQGEHHAHLGTQRAPRVVTPATPLLQPTPPWSGGWGAAGST